MNTDTAPMAPLKSASGMEIHLRAPATMRMLYGDAQLNELESTVVVSSQTLKAAYAAYVQYRDQVRIDRAALFPTLDLSAGAS